jgi:hypothetical protein
MKFLLLLALKLAMVPVPLEGTERSRVSLFTLEETADTDRPILEEESWLPFPHLRYDDGGTPPVVRREGFEAESFEWRAASVPERLKFRSLLDPLEAIIDLKHLSSSWDRAASEVTVTTDLSTLANSVGAPLGAGVFLGICVDLLAFPERDGGRLPLLDPRHGALRPGDISTGFGLTLGF